MHYFIVNPLSGSGKGTRYAEEIRCLLADKAQPFVMKITEYAGHATQLAEEICALPDCSVVVAVGGDGTFYEVLNGMDIRVPLGLIPSGTGNDFARALGLKSNCNGALQDILEGTPTPADYIDVNGIRSLNVVGTGFDVDLTYLAAKIHKHMKGAISFYIALLYTLVAFPFRSAKIIIDDQYELNAPIMLIAAANGKKYGGGLPIAPDAEIDDGFMDVVIIKKVPRWKIPALLIQFLKGKLLLIKEYVEFYRCKKVFCQLEKPLMLNVDGELVSSSPFTAQICAGALRIFRPFDKK